MVGHQGGPCPGSRDDAAGWAASDWQQCCCSRKKLLLGLGGLGVRSTGRAGAGPLPPSWRAALTPSSQHSHLHRPRYHPIPPRPPEHRAPALVQGLPGCNTFIQCHLYSVSPSVSLRLETPAQPSSPRRCPQWGSATRGEREHPGQPEHGQVLAASLAPGHRAPQPRGCRDKYCPAALPAAPGLSPVPTRQLPLPMAVKHRVAAGQAAGLSAAAPVPA